MMANLILTLTVVLCGHAIWILATKYENVVHLQHDLLSNYTFNVRPIKNQSEALPVHTSFALKMIHYFNDIDGTLVSNLEIDWRWRDEFLTWDPLQYGNVKSLNIPISEVWYPNVIVSNSVGPTNLFDGSVRNLMLKVDNEGNVHFRSDISVTSSCQLNVIYFPLDEHLCNLFLKAIGYGFKEITFHSEQTLHIASMHSFENQMWKIKPHIVSTYSHHGHSYIDISMFLVRRPVFLLFNLLLPMMMLVMLQNFVYFIPSESGEKISVAITIFLTLAVFVSVMMDYVPHIATTVPNITIAFITLLINNAFNCFMCICTVFMYHIDDDVIVGKHWRQFVRLISCGNKKKRESVKPIDDIDLSLPSIQQKDKKTPAGRTTWKCVSKALDRLGFYVSVLSIIVLLLILALFRKY